MAQDPSLSSLRAAVFVEGESDRRALEALAARRGRDLEAEGVSIVSMGGAHGIGRFLERYWRGGAGLRVAGLYDVGEEDDVRRGMERAGLGTDLTRAGMEALGFFVCEPDLEGELIRALGAEAVQRIAVEQGSIGAFRTLQKQAYWLGRPVEEQLRRFMGSGGSRKIRYASLMVDALDLDRVPRPLDGVLAAVGPR